MNWKLLLSLFTLAHASSWGVWNYLGYKTAKDSSLEGIVEEFEVLHVENSGLDLPATRCIKPGETLVIISKAWDWDYGFEIDQMSDFCQKMGVICNFAFDGSDLNSRPSTVEMLKRIYYAGNGILIEPATASRAAQLSPEALLAAVKCSAERIERSIGVHLQYVHINESELTEAQIIALVKSGYLPVASQDTQFLVVNPGRNLVNEVMHGIKALQSQAKSFVSLAACTSP